MKRLLLLLGLAGGIAGCTEHLTTVGSCPTYCPGGQAVFRDTTLTAIPNGDSSFTGFLDAPSLPSVLTSSGGQYGQNRGVFRFLPRTDSVLVSDTSRAFTLDSVTVELGIQAIDTTVGNFVLEVYRLPLTVDTSTSFTTLDALMTPANLLTEIPEPVAFRSGVFHFTLQGDSLARVAFAPADSTTLMIGFRVRADGPTAVRIGTPASGDFAPLFTSYVHAVGVVDSLQQQTVGVIASQYFTVAASNTPPPSTLLAVGGIPVSRSFIRFALTPFLHDTATIIRATLHLEADGPVIGIPADTAVLVATSVLTDFGPKSPVIASVFGSIPLLSGAAAADIEVGPVVQLWQGKSAAPAIIRLALVQEGGTFTFPLFHSTRSPSGAPTLRITYRPPFAFEGY